MKINESYDGRTWLKDWWIIVKSNFAIIKENVEAIISDVVNINNQIEAQDRQLASLEEGRLSLGEQIDELNEVCEYKQPKDYIVTCNVTINKGNTITIADASTSYTEIKKAVESGTNVILKVVSNDGANVYYARLEEDHEYGDNYYWSFWIGGVCYRILCDFSDIWYSYVIEFATKEILDDKIGEYELRTSEDTITGAINEIHQMITGEVQDGINDKQDKTLYVTCNANIDIANKTITITDASEVHADIKRAVEMGTDVVLQLWTGITTYYARLEENLMPNYSWSFIYKGEDDAFDERPGDFICYIECIRNNSWHGYITELATEEKLNAEIDKVGGWVDNCYNALQHKDFIVSCEMITIQDSVITIGNPSASYDEIKEAYEEGRAVVLKASIDSDYFARLTYYDGDFGWSFMYAPRCVATIWCLSDNSWSGTTTDLAKSDDITALNTQIGDINTALENALNGGVS